MSVGAGVEVNITPELYIEVILPLYAIISILLALLQSRLSGRRAWLLGFSWLAVMIILSIILGISNLNQVLQVFLAWLPNPILQTVLRGEIQIE